MCSYMLHIVGTPPFLKGGVEIQAEISKRRGRGFEKFLGLKGGAFSERGGEKFNEGQVGFGFLDIIFHPFQMLFLVSFNR